MRPKTRTRGQVGRYCYDCLSTIEHHTILCPLHLAAPELLEAAKEVITWFDKAADLTYRKTILNQTLESAAANWNDCTVDPLDMTKLKTAVAKAEGRSK